MDELTSGKPSLPRIDFAKLHMRTVPSQIRRTEITAAEIKLAHAEVLEAGPIQIHSRKARRRWWKYSAVRHKRCPSGRGIETFVLCFGLMHPW